VCVSAVALLLPLFVSAGVLLIRVGSGFHALSDNGMNELHTRDVGRHLVLVGPYSRDGWNHFGPAMYFLLAVPYRLTGSHSVGMYVGALLINGAALVGVVLIAWRRGGLPVLLLTVLGFSLVMHTLGANFLRDPWNPYVTVLPFGLLLFLVWEVMAGSSWALPAAVGVGSFLVQTHVGYVPLAVPLALGAAVWVLLARHASLRGEQALEHRTWRSWNVWTVTAAVVAVLWLFPIIGAIQHTAGNIVDATHYFLHPKGHHSLLDGYRIVAAPFTPTADWITGTKGALPFTGEPAYLHNSVVPWLAIPFLFAAYVLWRRRIIEGLHLALVVTAAIVLGILAVTRTIGVIYEYRLRWTWILGMLAMLLVGWAGWIVVQRALPGGLARYAAVPVVAAIAVFTVANTVSAARTATPQQPQASVLARLVPPLIDALPRRPGVVIVSTSPESWEYTSGVVLWLERRGIAAQVPDTQDAEQSYGYARVYHGGPVRARVTIAGDAAYDRLASDPAQRLVTYRSPVSRSTRKLLVAEVAAVTDRYRAGFLSAPDVLSRVESLNRRLGHATAVFIEVR
jgi:hypothetical protein